MKTKEEMLHFIMEAAGECVYESHQNCSHICKHCGLNVEIFNIPSDINPSPDDMNKLMELAENLNCAYVINNRMAKVLPEGETHWTRKYHESKPAEALLSALFVAKGGSNE